MTPDSSLSFQIATEAFARSDRSLRGVLVRVVGQPPGSLFRLSGGACIVGSAPSCDVVIHDPTVSQNHLELAVVENGVAVRDLGSGSGSYYCGSRIEKAVLGPRAVVTLGSARLSIEPDVTSLGVEPFVGPSYRGLTGTSPAMRELFEMLTRLEGSALTVQLTGEPGVSKDLVARALHEGSRVSGPFVTMDCRSISRDRFASAISAFERADKGSLFLDEIGELPLDVQPALLRVLESGEGRGPREDRVERMNVRIISATHRDLESAVTEGRFREDLYYRLAVIKVHVPPASEEGPKTETPLELFIRGIDVTRSYAELKDDVLDRFQSVYLAQLITRTNGNQTAAAKLSGLDRTYLGRLLAKHGLGR